MTRGSMSWFSTPAIPGCPPTPETLLKCLLALLSSPGRARNPLERVGRAPHLRGNAHKRNVGAGLDGTWPGTRRADGRLDRRKVSALMHIHETRPHRTAAPPKRRTYERIAGLYDLLDLPFEYARYRPLRRRVFEGVGGTVLDAGVGTGRNLPFYPPEARVVGIDFSDAMLKRAERRRARLGATVDLRSASVLRTGLPDRHFDFIVATFLFCVLDDADQRPALEELARICKPTGEIRILEYAWPESRFRQAVMRAWAPWVRWAYGAAFDRNTEQYIPAAGLELVECIPLHDDIIKLIVARVRPGEA